MDFIHGHMKILSQRRYKMLEISLENRKFKFNLVFYGKLNFILGDSGGHKSYLAEVALNYLDGLHRTKGVFRLDGKVLTQERILVFDNKNNLDSYIVKLQNIHNCVVIIDEFCKIHKERGFGRIIMESDNYFIFISRKVYGFLPVNVQSVYNLARNGRMITNVNAYSKFNKRFFGDIRYILTEDSSGGRQFFVKNFPDIETCSSFVNKDGKKHSRDNSQLHNYLLQDINYGKDNILVVYDSSAYASFYPLLLEVLEECQKKHKKIKVLDWESFEAYLLALPVFNEVYGADDTHCQFNSVELLCESRLKELINYNKSSLPACFNCMLSCGSCQNFSTCQLKAKLDKADIISGVLKTINYK